MANSAGNSAHAMKMAMVQVMRWSTTDFVLTVVMWAVMMISMMVPAAAPMILLFATMAQWGLHQAAVLSSMMGSVSPVLGGSLLIAAGIFQWTPLKSACLKHCRSPLDHLISHWRDGAQGAFRMGIEHGMYCLGCC